MQTEAKLLGALALLSRGRPSQLMHISKNGSPSTQPPKMTIKHIWQIFVLPFKKTNVLGYSKSDDDYTDLTFLSNYIRNNPAHKASFNKSKQVSHLYLPKEEQSCAIQHVLTDLCPFYFSVVRGDSPAASACIRNLLYEGRQSICLFHVLILLPDIEFVHHLQILQEKQMKIFLLGVSADFTNNIHVPCVITGPCYSTTRIITVHALIITL